MTRKLLSLAAALLLALGMGAAPAQAASGTANGTLTCSGYTYWFEVKWYEYLKNGAVWERISRIHVRPQNYSWANFHAKPTTLTDYRTTWTGSWRWATSGGLTWSVPSSADAPKGHNLRTSIQVYKHGQNNSCWFNIPIGTS